MRTLTRLIGVAVAGVLGLGVIGVGAAHADRVAPEHVVSLLSSSATASDALPSTLPVEQFGAGGLVPGSARLAGTEGPRSYWVATDRAGQICVIVELGDKGQTIAGACNEPARVQKSGQILGAQGIDGIAYVVALLPDSADETAIHSSWALVGDNVAVTVEGSGEDLHVPLQDGSVINLDAG